MQFRVPQFIETEDKVIGPLTLKQFGYIAGAGTISFLLYFTVTTWLWFVGSVVLLGAGISLAFVKVNGLPLPKVILASATFYWKPRRYVWQTGESASQGTRDERLSLERIVQGLALKRAWRYIQTGSVAKEEKPKREHRSRERFQLFHRPTGEHRIARRVDYL